MEVNKVLEHYWRLRGSKTDARSGLPDVPKWLHTELYRLSNRRADQLSSEVVRALDDYYELRTAPIRQMLQRYPGECMGGYRRKELGWLARGKPSKN